jgi:hypothetical protein
MNSGIEVKKMTTVVVKVGEPAEACPTRKNSARARYGS